MSVAPLRRLRGASHRVARPIVASLAGKVHPDVITVASMALCGAGGAALATGGPAWLLVPASAARLALDILDGEVARASGRVTPFGGVLGDLGDGVGDTLLYGGLALGLAAGGAGAAAVSVVMVLVFGLLGELVGVAVAAHGGARGQEGPVGKLERMAGLGAVALAGPEQAVGLTWVLAGLAAATVVRRAVAARAALGRRP